MVSLDLKKPHIEETISENLKNTYFFNIFVEGSSIHFLYFSLIFYINQTLSSFHPLTNFEEIVVFQDTSLNVFPFLIISLIMKAIYTKDISNNIISKTG